MKSKIPTILAHAIITLPVMFILGFIGVSFYERYFAEWGYRSHQNSISIYHRGDSFGAVHFYGVSGAEYLAVCRSGERRQETFSTTIEALAYIKETCEPRSAKKKEQRKSAKKDLEAGFEKIFKGD